jgi:hypothetical protein
MNEWMDGLWTDGWMDGWMDGRVTKGRRVVESLKILHMVQQGIKYKHKQ